MDESTLISSVLSHTPAYHGTSSRLTSLNDLPVPDASSSAALVSLLPRIHAARQRQAGLESQIDELRAQSARVIERWYELGIVGMGECWCDWEGRLREVEQSVRREEGRRRREAEAV